MSTIALCSLLHEPAIGGSTTRCFRGQSVLRWTMRRLALTTRIDRVVVLAWDDQLETLGDIDVVARACGLRRPLPNVAAVAAAQRWAEGWRGGLLHSCWFDKGFVADLVRDAMSDEQADNVVLVDPAAGLVDPAIIDNLVTAADAGTRDFYFTQAAPGLGGVLLRRKLVDTLAADRGTPGRLVHYSPDAPILDPITSESCVAVPLEISRVPDRFTLDSDRQIRRLESATQPLNGTLIRSHAVSLVQRVAASPQPSALPRDVVLELTPRRGTQPIFSPARVLKIDRPDLSAEHFGAVIEQLAGIDDLRITLAGVGDPLLHPKIGEWLPKLTRIAAVSIETDLLNCRPGVLEAIVAAGVDVVAVHLPATSPAVYAQVMGVDTLTAVLGNVRRLLEVRARAEGGLPVVAPLFTKLLANFDEMEAWYDTWLRAIGSAVIVGPSTFGNRVTGIDVADMTPPVRRPCARLKSRVTVLSDGTIVACEQDVLGEYPLGRLEQTTIAAAWHGPMNELRERHVRLTQLPRTCERCNEWHRP